MLRLIIIRTRGIRGEHCQSKRKRIRENLIPQIFHPHQTLVVSRNILRSKSGKLWKTAVFLESAGSRNWINGTRHADLKKSR